VRKNVDWQPVDEEIEFPDATTRSETKARHVPQLNFQVAGRSSGELVTFFIMAAATDCKIETRFRSKFVSVDE
jgi:hypothetical protein